MPESKISIANDVTSQRIEDETVVLNIATGEYFGLRAESSRAWDLLQEDKNQSQIVAILAEEFDAPKERIESDLSQFFEDLRRKNLVAF